jgi:hypothetical protein
MPRFDNWCPRYDSGPGFADALDVVPDKEAVNRNVTLKGLRHPVGKHELSRPDLEP